VSADARWRGYRIRPHAHPTLTALAPGTTSPTIGPRTSACRTEITRQIAKPHTGFALEPRDERLRAEARRGHAVQRAIAAAAADPIPGKRTLTEHLGPGLASAPAHGAPAPQVAERDSLNAVITVVARGPDGAVLARWRARGCWIGPLPARYHGTRAPLAWTWSDPAARDTRLHTRSDGTGGEPVERWVTQLGAATVDVVATAIDAAAPDDDASEAPGPAAAGDAKHDRAPLAGLDAEHQQIVAEFERRLGLAPDLDAADDAIGGRGARGGDPHGRTGADTAIGGTGPGGPNARGGGDHEGSETRGAVEGSRLGSALGVEGGSEGGRFGGEGKPGDDGVRMAGAIKGGVIAVPLAIKGVVEILLIADAGDVTGAGGQLFSQLGKKAAGMSAAALRELIAQEARVACRSAVEAAAEKLARSPRWLALSVEDRVRAMQIAFNEQMRRFFRGFGKAAKDAERTATKALRGATGPRKAVAQEGLDAAKAGAEAAEVEPVAGRLPRNHQYAGKEFPREQLPAKYREKGLRFKANGHPDFEPYAMTATERQEDGTDRADRLAAGRRGAGEQGGRAREDAARPHVEPPRRGRYDDARAERSACGGTHRRHRQVQGQNGA